MAKLRLLLAALVAALVVAAPAQAAPVSTVSDDARDGTGGAA